MHARVEHVLGHDDLGVGEHLVAGALSPASQSKMWLSVLPSLSSRMTGAPGSMALRASMTPASGLVLDVDQLERVAGRVAVLGDDERDLLALEADLVGGEHGLHVVGERRHPGQPERLEHAPVMTALTFGWASAADVSIETIRAWANGLRRMAPCSMPGSCTSST